MKQCDNCENEVTEDYFRVFSVRGTLHSCYECQSMSGQHGPSTVDSTDPTRV